MIKSYSSKVSIFLITLLAISLISKAEAASIAPKNYLITSNSIGEAKIGMSLADLRKIMPESNYIFEPDQDDVDVYGCRIYQKANQEKEELFFIVIDAKAVEGAQPAGSCDGIIYSIITTNALFKTKEDIGVSSLISEAEKKYGTAYLSYSIDDESREYITFENIPEGMMFRSLAYFSGIYSDNEENSQITSRYKKDATIDMAIITPTN